MAKKNNTITFIILAVVAVFLVVRLGGQQESQALVGTEATIVRQAPSRVDQGSSFTLTYEAQSVSGEWGVSIQDIATGGCTFPSGSSEYQSVMLSSDGTTKSITITAPSTKGSCTFSGNYLFSDETGNLYEDPDLETYYSMSDLTLDVCTPDWSCDSYGTCTPSSGTCGTGTQTRTCTDSNSCGTNEGKPSESQSCCVPCCDDWSSMGSCDETMPDGCGGSCTRTVTRNDLAPDQDTNCDGSISRIELGSAITGWINDAITRDELGYTISAWVGG